MENLTKNRNRLFPQFNWDEPRIGSDGHAETFEEVWNGLVPEVREKVEMGGEKHLKTFRNAIVDLLKQYSVIKLVAMNEGCVGKGGGINFDNFQKVLKEETAPIDNIEI